MNELQIGLVQGSSQPAGVPLGKLLDVTADDVRAALEQHVQGHARGQVHATALGMLAEDAAKDILENFRIDPISLAFQAWTAVRELEEYADPAKHPPGESNVVRWGKCSIKAPQKLDVKLTVLGTELPVLSLCLDLRADFHSLALTIRDGAIHKITPGPATASVALKCGDATIVRERSTPELQFQQGISFDPGLALGWKKRGVADI